VLKTQTCVTRPQCVNSYKQIILACKEYRALLNKIRPRIGRVYRVSIKSFPDYKYLLQENYVEYNRNITINTRHKILETNLSNGKKYVCIPRSFLVINVRNQGKTLCSLCIVKIWTMSFEKTEMPKSSTVREIRTRGMTQTVSLF